MSTRHMRRVTIRVACRRRSSARVTLMLRPCATRRAVPLPIRVAAAAAARLALVRMRVHSAAPLAPSSRSYSCTSIAPHSCVSFVAAVRPHPSRRSNAAPPPPPPPTHRRASRLARDFSACEKVRPQACACLHKRAFVWLPLVHVAHPFARCAPFCPSSRPVQSKLLDALPQYRNRTEQSSRSSIRQGQTCARVHLHGSSRGALEGARSLGLLPHILPLPPLQSWRSFTTCR